MGTGGPGLWGTGPRPTATTLTGPAHLSQAAPAGSSCVQGQRGPTCRKVPGEKSQGFPSGRSQRRGSRAGGVRLQIWNSWTSQK